MDFAQPSTTDNYHIELAYIRVIDNVIMPDNNAPFSLALLPNSVANVFPSLPT